MCKLQCHICFCMHYMVNKVCVTAPILVQSEQSSTMLSLPMSGITQKEAEQWAQELDQAWLEQRTGSKKRVRFPEPVGLPISFSPDGKQAKVSAGQGKEPVAAPHVAVPVAPAQPKRPRPASAGATKPVTTAQPGQGISMDATSSKRSELTPEREHWDPPTPDGQWFWHNGEYAWQDVSGDIYIWQSKVSW